MIQTENLFTGLGSQDKRIDVNCVGVTAVDSYDNVSLSGQPCDYKNYTVVDNGPKVLFAGAARNESGAVIRVQVIQEKFFASGVFTLNDWVGFSVDGGPQIALPAKGVEPVYVTAYFPGLSPGPHHIFINVFDGFYDSDGAPQGTVCV